MPNLTPNMSLIQPEVGVTPGPDYANQDNNNLSTIDQHDHTNGSGVPITPAALDINTDLPMGGHSLTNVKALTLTAQTSFSTLYSMYAKGNDFYLVDGLGNDIRLTQSGGIAGSPGSIANLTSPASATYVSANQTFVWQSDSSIAANMDAGALLLRNLSPNSTYALTLSPPASLSANYTLTLPALPASQKIMTLDATGAMSAPYVVDNSTLEISSNTIRVKDSGIVTAKIADSNVTTAKIADSNVTTAKIADSNVTTAKIADSNVTTAKIAAGNVTLTKLAAANFGSSGAVTTSVSGAITGVAGCTITTTGRPVMIKLVPSGAAGTSGGIWATATDGVPIVRIYRDATCIAEITPAAGTGFGSVEAFEQPGAGTYAYAFEVGKVSGSGAIAIYSMKIVAVEY